MGRSDRRPVIVAIDSNVFIYGLEDPGESGQQALKLLRRMETNDVSGIASTLCLAEVTTRPWRVSREAGEQAQAYLEWVTGIDFLPVDTEVALRSSRIRAECEWKLGLADAIHLASALQGGAEIFVTNDQALTNIKLAGLDIRLLGEALD